LEENLSQEHQEIVEYEEEEDQQFDDSSLKTWRSSLIRDGKGPFLSS